MTMRKKDYEAIARAISATSTDQHCSPWAWEYLLARKLADYCATQDPTFKRDRFLADCGVSQS